MYFDGWILSVATGIPGSIHDARDKLIKFGRGPSFDQFSQKGKLLTLIFSPQGILRLSQIFTTA